MKTFEFELTSYKKIEIKADTKEEARRIVIEKMEAKEIPEYDYVSDGKYSYGEFDI